MAKLRGLVALAIGLTLAGATTPPQVISWDRYGEALIVPSGAPLQFTGIDENRVARFKGSAVVTGTFVYGCDIECKFPLAEQDLVGSIVADTSISERLPHWKIRGGGMRIYLHDAPRLAAQVFSQKELTAIASGRLNPGHKRVSVVIENFSAAIECDSATYEAHFVSLAAPATGATASNDGNSSCSWI